MKLEQRASSNLLRQNEQVLDARQKSVLRMNSGTVVGILKSLNPHLSALYQSRQVLRAKKAPEFSARVEQLENALSAAREGLQPGLLRLQSFLDLMGEKLRDVKSLSQAATPKLFDIPTWKEEQDLAPAVYAEPGVMGTASGCTCMSPCAPAQGAPFYWCKVGRVLWDVGRGGSVHFAE
jgi:hypothetical protein